MTKDQGPRTKDEEALALVHQGWEHRKLQRPLAAWACWQRALRLAPGDPAATQALDLLANADDLPAAARAAYRFRPPRGEERRSRWDERLRGRDLEDLQIAAETFAELALADPTDAAARYNQALCLAWLGKNPGAIAALDRVVSIEAADSPESAVEAWTLAEVLRQGAGAEHLCDDLGHTLVIDWPDDLGDPIEWLSSFADLEEKPPPTDPATRRPVLAGARVFEWLNRPMPPPSSDLGVDDLPRVEASVIATPDELRLSSPVAGDIQAIVDTLLRGALGDHDIDFDRRSTPLPFALMDAAVWLFRIPEGLDEATHQHLMREAVERFFEGEWLHVPRYGLGRRLHWCQVDRIDTPLPEPGDRSVLVEPASPSSVYKLMADESEEANDKAIARAKLEAVIRIREQLAARPRVAPLYGGYPFDRLRRRLGLEPIDPAAIDPADVSCMSEAELAKLDPSALDEPTLNEAYRSVRLLALPIVGIASRFATALAERNPSTLLRVDPPLLAYAVIYWALEREGPERALQWIDRAVALAGPADDRYRGSLECTRGYILDDAGDHEAAVRQYRSLLDRFPDDAQLLYIAASYLAGGDEDEAAIPLLRRAVERARETGDRARERHARSELDRLGRKGLT